MAVGSSAVGRVLLTLGPCMHTRSCSCGIPFCAVQVYRTLLRYSTCIQPLSCDEAYIDVTGEDTILYLLVDRPVTHPRCPASRWASCRALPLALTLAGLGDPEVLAAAMRADILAATGCTASCGIGEACTESQQQPGVSALCEAH